MTAIGIVSALVQIQIPLCQHLEVVDWSRLTASVAASISERIRNSVWKTLALVMMFMGPSLASAETI